MAFGGLALIGAGVGLGASTVVEAAPTEPNALSNPLAHADGCAQCHVFFNPPNHAGEPSIDPWAWQGSMMANAARDPVFWAGVAIAGQDLDEGDSGAEGTTEDCVRCHAPRAFLEGRGDARSLAELTFEDREGIACDFCHRLTEDPDAPSGVVGNARYVLDDLAIDGKVPKRGPWSYPDEGPRPEHETLVDAQHLPSAKLCGTCHDVTTERERVDAQGDGMGVGFNEQRTYSEWANSEFADPGGDTCQDCHMPAIVDAVGCKEFTPLGIAHEQGGRTHQLVGANVGVMRALQVAWGSAGAMEVDDFFYDQSITYAQALLQTGAQLEVEFPDAWDVGAESIPLPIRVVNRTGHKLPTGYSEGRVMWIEVRVAHGDEVLTSLGLWDPETGMAAHDEDGVRRYEAIAEDADDGSRLHLVRNNRWVVDTRIPPAGLQLDPQTDPVGDRYVASDGRWPNEDAFTLELDPVGPADPAGEPSEAEIRVRLLHLVNTDDYLAFLADENHTNDAGAQALAMLTAEGVNEPQVLAEVAAAVPLVGVEVGTDGSTETGASVDNGSSGCACDVDRGRPRWGWLAWIVVLAAGRRRQISSITTARV